MHFLFIVQGEGRGHMTQAISLRNMLVQHGHEVKAVLVGQSARREIPRFFIEKIQSPVIGFESPNFVLDSKKKGLKIVETFRVNLLKTRTFLSNLKVIDQAVRQHEPQVVVNFYDLLAGMYSFYYKDKRKFKFVCVGHQLLLEHSAFEFPKSRKVEKFLLHSNTRIASAKSDLNLGLSFVPMPHEPKKRLYVVPPLLRKEVLSQKPEDKNFVLGYMVNEGYAEDIIAWHKQHKEISLVCFWDKKEASDSYSPHENLVFYRLNDALFLEHMRTCSGYVSTAGFESICEAMYWGKPILMVPTAHHYEQLCNSLDATKAGAGISHDTFDISLLVEYIPRHKNRQNEFQEWVQKAETVFLELLTQ